MSIFGYARVSTDKQEQKNQEHVLYKYATEKGFILNEIICETISSRKQYSERALSSLIDSMSCGDELIVYDLTRLSRSGAMEVSFIVDQFKSKGMALHLIKENMVFDFRSSESSSRTQKMFNECLLMMLGMFAEMERVNISERTKAGLAARRKAGIRLGRPKGTSLDASVIDKMKDLKNLGLSNVKIGNQFGIDRRTVASALGG